VAVAAVLDGAVERSVDVRLPGGMLTVEVAEDLSIRQTGAAERIATIELAPAIAARVRGR
jgi:diaminopimelate epimerase